MYGYAMHEGYPEWRWDPVNKIMVSDQVSDEMKNAVIFIRQLVAGGLMEPVMPVQHAADWFRNLDEDKIGHYYYRISGIPRRLAMRKSGENPDAEWVYMGNVKVPDVPRQPNYAPCMGVNVGITIKARDPGMILEWCDWALSKEGEFYYHFGIEGLNYVMEGDKVTYPDTVTPISNTYRYLIPMRERSREAYYNLLFGDMIVAVYDAAINDVQYRDTIMMPESIYEGYEDYDPSVATLYREKVTKMIMGEFPMSAWDDYVRECYAKGGTEIQERVTEWYKTIYDIK